MPNNSEALLKSIGISDEDIQAINSVPEDKVFDPSPYVGKIKESYQTQLKNDAAFFSDLTVDKLPKDVKKRLESEQYGRASNIVKDKALKAFGMTEAEFEDLPEEQRQKLETFMPVLAERYAKTKAGDKEMQNQLIQERKAFEKYREENDQEKIKAKFETEYNDKFTKAILTANLISELSAIPGLKISAADIAKTAKDIIESKYAFEKVGDFGVELRQKANPQMKVLKDNSSQELTLKEALTAIAEERGWVEKTSDPKTGKGTVTTKVEPNKGVLVMAPHLQDKISAKIAAEK